MYSPSSGLSSNSSNSTSSSGNSSSSGSSDDSTCAVPVDEPAADLPKGGARRLQGLYTAGIFASRRRSGKHNRAEEPASGSSHAFPVDLVRQGEEIDSDEGFGGCEFCELSDSMTSSSPWKPDEPSGALAL